jgi:hypothetical protein
MPTKLKMKASKQAGYSVYYILPGVKLSKLIRDNKVVSKIFPTFFYSSFLTVKKEDIKKNCFSAFLSGSSFLLFFIG